jgi:phosphate acyltransferase
MDRTKPSIAVDAMGGDFGPSVVVPGAVDAARRFPSSIILVGDKSSVTAELAKCDVSGLDVHIVHTTQVADMREKPSEVLRRKKDSSIMVACQLVKEGEAQGIVSAGNSGATVACGMFAIGRIPGVERPALAGILLTEKEPMVLIDVGANVDCKPYHLFQFGLMADVLCKDVLGKEKPRVGLLSIGEEEGKGNVQVKGAFELFKLASLNFVGNVEGRDIFSGNVDVAVCDGFVGNVALKLSEGLGASLARMLNAELTSSMSSRIITKLMRGSLRRFEKFVDYAEYGGAPLLGLQGIVIVSHGSSNVTAISNAVGMAVKFVQTKANDHLVEELSANDELTRFGKAIKY